VFRGVGLGFQSISGKYLGAGATNIHEYDLVYSRRLSTATNNYVRLHMFELHPGKDPDTIQGQADLNVAAWAQGTPRTAEFAAADAPIVHDNFGFPISNPNQCCRDFVSSTSPNANPGLAPWP
jgi:hypothetical protein